MRYAIGFKVEDKDVSLYFETFKNFGYKKIILPNCESYHANINYKGYLSFFCNLNSVGAKLLSLLGKIH